MEMAQGFVYKSRDDLVILNVWQGDFQIPTDIDGSEVDTWGNLAYEIVRTGFQGDDDELISDFDGSTIDTEGINILMPKDEVQVAIEALGEVGFTADTEEPHEGHYGDGNWAGADLLPYHDGWILILK